MPTRPLNPLRLLLASALALVLGSGPGLALSCLKPNAARQFNELVEAEEVYVVGIGRFTAPDGLPDVPEQKGGTARMHFKGELLGNGQTTPVSTPVQVTTECASVWCGGFPELGVDRLVFLQRAPDGGDPTLTLGPCPYFVLSAPTPTQLRALDHCFAAGTCSEADIAAFEF